MVGAHRLDDLAKRIRRGASWDDLVLPAPRLAALREIAAELRHIARHAQGRGVSALFSGGSRDYRALAAEALASELGLDLYRIDLSAVVSKYLDETEKNLRRLFDAAEGSGAILLFDEADALFGARSEVKDSHDRYANLAVGYLLQCMEAYRGLAILTLSHDSSLDPVLKCRMRFVVTFP